uniref:Transcription repressor n=1 Tax=Leersia perrieri TaxID=77586 RepID=A0A0D9VQS4_9ORYZ
MAKRLFHSCRSPSAVDALVTSTTTFLASDHKHVVTGPRRLACRRPQPPGVCGAAVDGGVPPRASYRWLKSSQWHVIEAAGVTDDDHTPRLKIDARRRLRRPRRRIHHHQHRRADPAVSGSSGGDSGWFTSDEDSYYANSCVGGEEEAESTVVTSTATTESSSGGGEAADIVVDGTFAVVKRSDDPRADFRRSMAEMVVERAIYDADGLERLLRCFLALNHQRHRRDIVDAFGDVWEAVFSNPTTSSSHRGIVAAEPTICKAAAACNRVKSPVETSM